MNDLKEAPRGSSLATFTPMVKYVPKAIDDMVRDELRDYLEKVLIPGFQSLEKIAGGQLLFVLPENHMVPFSQYLGESTVHEMNDTLKLGEYWINLQWGESRSDGQYSMFGWLTVSGPDGLLGSMDDAGYLNTTRYIGWSAEEYGQLSSLELRTRFYRALEATLFSGRNWPYKSAKSLILSDLERRAAAAQKAKPKTKRKLFSFWCRER